ncbi:MAG: NUDIX domain-containing protein [Rickettsiales bacterium]|nr:NUDIX domain-containing protein [Rickettsiales bacterium]
MAIKNTLKMLDDILITGVSKEKGNYPINKLEAHVEGVFHLAISIFLINEKGELLLQRRSLSKYHSEGLWANSCCSHPSFGENEEGCAYRRLKEELGVQSNLTTINKIDYKCDVGNLIENERVTWFRGFLDSSQVIDFNKEEVMDVSWISIDNLEKAVKEKPQIFANWLHRYLSVGLVDILQSSVQYV